MESEGSCKNCGRLSNSTGKFCNRCGTCLKIKCPQCRQEIDVSSVYCSNCGKRMDESK
ncbi:MAG: hypothetical protein HFI70_16210 [Lachnospiraceae bacterium]|nr:hypothetical protein [Lachnospiraceae bacterium]